MLTSESYQVAWAIYLVAASGLLLLCFFLLRPRLVGGARMTGLFLLAALVLTPARVDQQHDTQAPALVAAAFELLTHGSEAAARPAKILLLTLIAALALGLVYWVLGRWVFKPRSK